MRTETGREMERFIGGVEEQLRGLLPFLDFYLHVYKVGGYFSPHCKDGLHEKENPFCDCVSVMLYLCGNNINYMRILMCYSERKKGQLYLDKTMAWT